MEEYQRGYRHYLAMTLALDDMLGQLLEYLDKKGLVEKTITVFTSDHGTQGCAHDYLRDGEEWRGVKTKTHTYVKWLHGLEELYDNAGDPLQQNNLVGNGKYEKLYKDMKCKLENLMKKRNDELVPCTSYTDWFDEQRRVVKNVYGPMSNPEDPPDWSLLD